MGQWSKAFRRYERHALLVLVVLLLVSFSITGALRSCGAKGAAPERRLGGSFQATPTRRVEIPDADFERIFQRFDRYVSTTLQPATVDFLRMDPLLAKRGSSTAIRHAWIHLILARAAEAAGYRCGERQLGQAVLTVIRGMPNMGIQGTREGYEQFIRNLYGGSASEFETTLREIIAKDELVSTLADPARFQRTYAEAYELWKGQRERVDLAYVAVEASAFAAEVREEETTRQRMSEQEDLLRQLGETGRRLKALQARLEEYKKAKGVWPDKLAVLAAPDVQTQPWSATEAQIKDAWGADFLYQATEAGVTLASPGADGKQGTPDDLTGDLQAQLESHRTLARTAEALVRWHGGADPQVWPDALDKLTQAPPRKPPEPGAAPTPALPTLSKLEKDAWGSDLVYAPGTGDAPPTLSSAGPDKTPGTADDIPATVSAERARVSPGPALAAYVRKDLVDAWGRPLSLHLRQADQGSWEVTSQGRDGQPGTVDDLQGGNRAEMETFYGEAGVREELRQPVKREFEALVMHLPRVSDATLRRLWLDFPDLRPISKADEDQLFRRWQTQRGSSSAFEFQAGTDPRDPETGHGAAFAKRMWPGEKVTLVPDRSVFEVPGTPPPAPAGSEAAPTPPDPLRKEYDERGWREILLRQEFLERVLNQFWQQVVESHRARSAWEASEVRITRRPDLVTLNDLLGEDRLGKYMPGEADRAQGVRFLESVASKGLVTEKDIEGMVSEFGDPKLAGNPFVSNTTGNEPAPIPIQLNQRLTKVLFFNKAYERDRTPPLAEVSAQVFERFVVRRQYARAERELRALQRDVEKRTGERKEGETDDAIWEAALAAWTAAHPGVPVHVESTGLYIAREAPRRPTPVPGPEGQAQLRRAFVRELGYALVAPSESKQDTTEAKPGTFGRRILQDTAKGEQATGCAYLVRVKDRVFPSKAEFSPSAYADFLEEDVFARGTGDPARERNMQLQQRKGTYPKALAPYFNEIERLQVMFDLRTNTILDQLGI